MSYAEDIAVMLRARDTPPPQAGYYIGSVVCLSPLTIALMDGEVMASGSFLAVSETISRLLQPLPDCTFNGCTCGGSCTHQCFPQPLKVGDRVVCVGHNRFCAIDRVV